MKFMPAPADVAISYLTMADSNLMGLLTSTHVVCTLVCEKVNDYEATMVRCACFLQPPWLYFALQARGCF